MLWLVGYLFEFLVVFGVVRTAKYQKYIATALIAFVFGSTVWLAMAQPQFIPAVFVIFPFRVLNLMRIIKNRMHPLYLKRMTARTSFWLAAFQAIAIVISYSIFGWIWSLLPLISLLIAVVMLLLLITHLKKTRHITNTKHFSDSELPTVSVCIPARNETSNLEDCLRSILTNDYPKLEILVLDDCSQDRTAEIIKGFAHDGVRFIQGDEPKDRWLAKNQAYDKLAREATGELILFCGVDVRLGSAAIRALTTTLINRNKSMISVLPLRFYSKASEAFIQPMRYWWELVPPRKLFKRPAVLSTCWLIDRKKLEKAGGFGAVSHAIIPEGYFARHFIKTDSYSFIRADQELDVRTVKPFNEQWATAVRTNYPQIRRRPEIAFLLTLFTLGILIMPFMLVPIALITMNIQLVIIVFATCAVLTVTHVLILQHSDPGNVPLGFINLPFSAFGEAVIGYTSMLRYEFGSVDWKDRNVCIPVMHVVPKHEFLTNGNFEKTTEDLA